MKKHAIIPIFISHRGCPHDCIFCNQKRITSRSGDVTAEDARKTIEEWLTTLSDVETVEVSFYGGSFTGIPMEEQNAFLDLALEYKKAGKIDKIHLSTRPDYIDKTILDNLKAHEVDVIELGVQSFDPEVLRLSERGHDVKAVYSASEMIKSYGFTLGIQLMVGLPGDSYEKCMYSTLETIKIHPEIARIYPVVVLNNTKLHDLYEKGEYMPFDLDKSADISAEMYEKLEENGIKVIRIGLKSSEIMENEVGFHPAFGQIVTGRVAFKHICNEIDELLLKEDKKSTFYKVFSNIFNKNAHKTIEISANSKYFNNIIGYKAENKAKLMKKYDNIAIIYTKNEEINDGEYIISWLN